MSFNNSGFKIKESPTLSEGPSGVTDGAGGGVLDIWTADRATKLSNLAKGNFTNESSFKIPPGIVNGADAFKIGGVSAEKKLGTNVDGTFLDVDGTPLSGKAKIKDGDTFIGSKSVSGFFFQSINPPEGVEKGEDISPVSYDFEFEPTTTGISYTSNNFGSNLSIGTIRYGKVTGKVTDINGNPVADVGVSSAGFSTATGSDGSYSAIGPGGTSVTISAIGVSNNVTLNSGSSNTVNFQYSRLTIKVTSPNGRVVKGAPVTINGASYKTNSSGEVVLETAEIIEYDVIVGEGTEDNFSISSQGSDITRSFGNAFAAIEVTMVDAESSQLAQSVPVTIDGPGNTIRAESTETGVASPLYDRDGTVTVTVAGGDNRYLAAQFKERVTTGQVKEVTENLIRKDNISTY